MEDNKVVKFWDLPREAFNDLSVIECIECEYFVKIDGEWFGVYLS